MQDRDFGRPILPKRLKWLLPPTAALASLAVACGFAGEKKGEEPTPFNLEPTAASYSPTATPEPEGIVIEATATQKPAATPEPTATVETPRSREGVVNLGRWEFGIEAWEEHSEREIKIWPNVPATYEVRDGWKYVTIHGRLRNVSQSIVNNGAPSIGREHFNFEIEADGFFYDSELSDFDPLYFQVPSGFSYPIEINAWVPQVKTDYSLIISTAVNYEPGERLGELRKNEVAVDYPQISPDVQIKNLGEIWELPGYAAVNFKRTYITDVRYLNYLQAQYISFEIQNNYGQDIRTSYGLEGLGLLVFLSDGRVINGTGGDYGEANGTEKPSQPKNIAPGLMKTVDINIAYTSRQTNYVSGEIYDLQGSVIVLILNNQWSAWRVE